MRLAIGAGRARLIRQLVVESLLIGSRWRRVRITPRVGSDRRCCSGVQLPTEVPLKLTYDLNDRVLLVGLIVATLSAVGSSLVPAWKSARTDLVSNLKSVGAADSRRTRLWGRNSWCAGRSASRCVLVTVAVFLFRAYQSEYGRGPGFRTDHVLLMSFEPDLAGYDTPRADRFYDLLSRSRQDDSWRHDRWRSPHRSPSTASASRTRPSSQRGSSSQPGTDSVRVRSARVDEGYFDTLGISHRRRPRIPPDRYAGHAARRRRQRDLCIALLARPERRRQALPPGQRRWHDAVDRDRRHRSGRALSRRLRGADRVHLLPSPADAGARHHDPAPHRRRSCGVRGAAARRRPCNRSRTCRCSVCRTMEDFYNGELGELTNLLIELVGGMGSMGLALAIVGLYGLVAYSVNRRTREIGIRMAVGRAVRCCAAHGDAPWTAARRRRHAVRCRRERGDGRPAARGVSVSERRRAWIS